ncbi:3-oxoacyl-ACP synthase III family protein [Mucilaginibacter sp. UR6-11]|uniref:3-oxoacyl-ACP synthase III family protein n=1 Tax=Mucilaginibacter sp. UR6-11 TaxID=1435644 RepID=UPI001E59AEB9|nr:ketoacyl-ACP synthase III [Mucilaginibacter sp. UR6-11]MCC8424867.1 ketoacyl-ACP synthase III [Mucilaginibacter sp. UR6-11]
MYQSFTGITIDGIASCVPKNIVSNDIFSDLLSPKEMKMFEKTVGIKERRWASDEIAASDLGYRAALELFADPQFDKDKIKCLIFVSQTSDYKIPFTSNILQSRLGLASDILCLDINAGCAGFIQGLSTAYATANSMEEGSVLLIIAETLSKILSPDDRSTTMLFGDAASAIIISRKLETSVQTYLNFFSDGKNHDAIQIPEGGFRNKAGSNPPNLKLVMDGSRVFDFTLREISASIIDLINYSKQSIENIDYLFLHQSNAFIINQILGQLGVLKAQGPINIQSFGNTSGVSIPLLITTNKDIFQDKSVKILCSGYGSGLTWGNAILDINAGTILKNLIEY